MKNQLHISVAIAVYNKEKQILSTLKSVLSQTYPPSEIILVNDGSTDKSETLIKTLKDPRIKYLFQTNQGASAARNKAIACCSHAYIALLDADDFWYPTYLEEIASAIKQYPEQKVFAAAIEIESKRNKITPASYSIPKQENIGVYNYFKASKKHSLLHSSSLVLHNSVCNQVGGFDTEILSGEDTDLWVRIGLKHSIVFIPRVLVRYCYNAKGLYQTPIPIKHRFSFTKFIEQEKNNPELKYFLDLNRYSLAIYAKETKDIKNYKLLKNTINKRHLSKKKRIILKLPGGLIRLLKKTF